MTEPNNVTDHSDSRFARPVFLVGCPRSGTTWLQLLLSQHPEVATATESHLFDGYLASWDRRWRWEQTNRLAGLTQLIDRQEFIALCRTVGDKVLAWIASTNPTARIVVEKTPQHALHVSLIQEVYPAARFLHMVRDPREVVASLRAAAREWGRVWAPRGLISAADLWKSHVRAARSVSQRADQYLEVRYEDLHARGPEELFRVFRWLGLAADALLVEEALKACRLEDLRKGSGPGRILPVGGRSDLAGFFRRGRAGGWRSDLSRRDLKVIESRLAQEMKDFGFEPVLRSTPSQTARARLHGFVRILGEGLGWRLSSLRSRL